MSREDLESYLKKLNKKEDSRRIKVENYLDKAERYNKMLNQVKRRSEEVRVELRRRKIQRVLRIRR